MAYDLDSRLVIGVASSALFDLSESHEVFITKGEEEYRKYQEANKSIPLGKGLAFPFIQRLLSLNDLADSEDPPVEVIVLSRNSPETGLRVMSSVGNYGLGISRAVFMEGRSPYKFMPAFHMSLFLSANEDDVKKAINLNLPAGQVVTNEIKSEFDDDNNLRIAFDFDGVLADDGSERIYRDGSLAEFQEHEVANLGTALNPGPLRDLLVGLNRLQYLELERTYIDPSYKKRVYVSLVTARSAPAHERAILSLKEWGVTVNDAFFLGGVEKAKVLGVLNPHIFFDDQKRHFDSVSVPCVHIPFGVRNE